MRGIIYLLRKNKNGHVSIELVVIGGLLIGFGAMSIGAFQNSSMVHVNSTNTTITEKFAIADLNKPINN